MPIIASIATASAPLFVGLTTQYFPEPLQLFDVTYLYWIAVKAPELSSVRICLHLLFATGLAMASKATSPIYCLLPGGLALYYALRNRDSNGSFHCFRSVRSQVVLILTLSVFGSTALWYFKNFSAVREFVRLASTSEVAMDYGRKDAFINKVQYWMIAIQKNVVMPEVLVLLSVTAFVGIVTVLVRYSSGNVSLRRIFLRLSHRNVVTVLALVHIIFVIGLFSLNVNEENRYLLPLLPSLVIIFLLAISFVRSNFGRIIIIALLVGQWSFSHSQALGFVPPSYKISHWVLPYKQDKLVMNEIEKLVTYTSYSGCKKCLNVVGVEFPWLNLNSLSFYSAKARLQNAPRCYYTYLGHAEKDPDQAWDRLLAIDSVYFLSVDEQSQPQPPDFLNRVSIPLLKRVRSDMKFIQEPFKSNMGVVIFRKTTI
jgi:hypothetical protein